MNRHEFAGIEDGKAVIYLNGERCLLGLDAVKGLQQGYLWHIARQALHAFEHSMPTITKSAMHPAYVLLLEHALRFGMAAYFNDLLKVDKNTLAGLPHTQPFLFGLWKYGTWLKTLAELKANNHNQQGAWYRLAEDYPSGEKGLYLFWDGYDFSEVYFTAENFAATMQTLLENYGDCK